MLRHDQEIITAGASEEEQIGVSKFRRDGVPALNFGKKGEAELSLLYSERTEASAAAVGPRGRIYTAGYEIDALGEVFGLIGAFNSDGTVDQGFGKHGFVKIAARHRRPVELSGIRLLPGGRILVAGSSGGRFLLARYVADGRRDRSFGGGDGRVLVDVDHTSHCHCAYASDVAFDGRKIVVAGNVQGSGVEFGVIARFDADGRLDRSFGVRGTIGFSHGKLLTINAVAVQRGGKITAAGTYNAPNGEYDIAAFRFRSDGRRDRHFGHRGFYADDIGAESIAYAALALRNGDVVIAGRANTRPQASPELESPLDGAQVFLMRFRAGA